MFTLNGLYHFSRWFGTLEWSINHKRRRGFAQGLERVFGADLSPRRRRRITRAHFQNTRCDKVFTLIMDLLPREQVLERFHVDPRALLDNGLSRSNGVYIALSHHGPHHVVGLHLALLGYKVAGVRDRKEGALRRFIEEKYALRYPELRRIRMFYADAYPRDIYRCLNENFLLGTALDVHRKRSAHQKTVPVTIFGEQREFLTGTLQIALRCGATVLQGLLLSEPGFHYRLQLLGPLAEPETASESPEVLARVMQEYADNIEAWIRRYPAHITRA
ncbi:MAG: hypothetical protein GY842_13775 [bacterium]|nr:hypothetical protein [bacterium]